MTTSLTTFDGYPRDDIDMAQIRTTRARIIHLKNDYKSLMARIETGLHAHHAALQSQTQSQTSTTAASPLPHHPNEAQETPFARVNSIVDGSPAASAGLKVGDQIRRFGHVNWMNHENLAQVGAVVGRSEGIPIVVKVLRRTGAGSGDVQELSLQLTPRRNWGGRGLLGCHLLPV
jgi:26S proteasome regulatory subunit N4